MINEQTGDKIRVMAVDYDGTIDSAGYPNTGFVSKIAIESLKKWREKGNKLILWTCRSGKALEDALSCMNNYGLKFDAVNENLPEIKELDCFKSPKIVADIYIDDLANGNKNLNEMNEIFQKINDGKI